MESRAANDRLTNRDIGGGRVDNAFTDYLTASDRDSAEV